MGQRVVRQEDGTLRQVSADKFLENTGTQSLRAYIDRSQTAVAKWVALRPILEVCDRNQSYEGGGRRRYPKWSQTAARKLSCTLKEISVAAMERRWKSGRRGGGGQYRDEEESEHGARSNGSQDDGTETGDAQVGERSCVAARRKYTGEWTGADTSTLTKRKSGGGRRRAERVKKSRLTYVTINDGV